MCSVPSRIDGPEKTPAAGLPRRAAGLLARGLAVCFLVLCLVAPPAPEAVAADPESGEFPLDFVTLRLGDARHKAVLVVGGIQGDEPGGFSAATLLGTRYRILEGAVWVVPNLNFPSIIRRSRGLHGDMNRKFARLDETDPQFPTVRRIQEVIRDPAVRLVLNLHDGSGFFRPEFEDQLRNPKRWGQCVVIDQENLDSAFMGALGDAARRACADVNRKLVSQEHRYHVHNTRTAEGDEEMEKSLSYYAVRHGKAAFGLEASKEFGVAQRAYYHLLAVESFLTQAGVRFKRDFDLTPAGVERALRENLGVSFADGRIFLPLEDVRPSLRFLPLPRNAARTASTSKPIMAVLPCESDSRNLCIHYGNRVLTTITPEWREMAPDGGGAEIVLDGERFRVEYGDMVAPKRECVVLARPGFRVNAIGFDSGREDESGFALKRSSFKPAFSVDRRGRIFRVEIYRGEKFCGMFLIRFNGDR